MNFNKNRVVFIAFEEYDNLGIGYLAAVLTNLGFEINVIDLRHKKEDILELLVNLNPILVGFSVIYQYNIRSFIEIISYLRKCGVQCHMTAGGHYASLKPDELFAFIPGLDSIVRFEGEYTISELSLSLTDGSDWHEINGLAYIKTNKVVSNPLRPLEKDLDKFPYPLRKPLSEYALGKFYAPLIAGRGCLNNCAFCNAGKFFRIPPGPEKRIRKPENVVHEMEYLFNHKNCSIFLFHDDDFPMRHGENRSWIRKFCLEIEHRNLKGRIMWKINCRPDEVDLPLFGMMKEFGLYQVFLGIDDGTDAGLKRLNKNMNISDCLEGIGILRELKIGFDYGFMLFQPSSTCESLIENLDFLMQICGDGYTPATFLKLMPYYETPVEEELRKAGRLKGEPGFRDYDFINPSINYLYSFLKDYFREWIQSTDGFVNIAKWALLYFAVHSFNSGVTPENERLLKLLRKVISEGNSFLIETLKKLLLLFEEAHTMLQPRLLREYEVSIRIKHEVLTGKINDIMDRFLRQIDYRETMHNLLIYG